MELTPSSRLIKEMVSHLPLKKKVETRPIKILQHCSNYRKRNEDNTNWANIIASFILEMWHLMLICLVETLAFT